MLKSGFTMERARAGSYVRQTQGYSAFIPKGLPPDPPLRVADRLQVLLSQADRAVGRLDGSIETVPNPDLIVYMWVRKEAVLSSQIEGTQSSLHDVLIAEAGAQPTTNDVGEVTNYISAMNYGLERLETLPVSLRLIREIHEKLLHDVRGSHLTPGELRRTQNWVGPAGCTLAEALYVPPPPHEVANHLSEWEKFLHADSGLPLLLKIGLAHAQFETIHPFLDGNGRVGRLLITFLLCEAGVLSKPVLYLSHHFKVHRTEYYERLQRVRDEGAWEDWLEFFLQGVVEVSKQATDTSRAVLRLREQHRTTITEQLGRSAGNGHRVLERLYKSPFVTVNEIAEVIGTTYPAANDLVSRLVDAGIISEFTGQQRNRRYWYRDYVSLFTQDDR